MKRSDKIFGGIIFIAAAVFIILYYTHVIALPVNFGIKKVIAAVICLILMKEGIENLISNREFGGIFASLAVAWVVFGPMIGLPKVKIWVAVLVAVLLTIGFGELFPKKKKFHHHGNNNSFSSSESTTDDNYVYCRTSFGEMTRYINSSDLKGAELKNSFGQLVVYFDNAIINDSSITINADNSFGETVIYIPKSWRLESKVRTSMGQCVIPESIADAAAPLVTITGHCKFGDLVVRYV